MATDVSMNDKRRARNPLAGRSWGQITPMGLYFALLTVIAAVLVIWQAPQLQGSPWVLALLIGMNIGATKLQISIYGDTVVSVGFIIALAIIVLFGAPGAVLLAPASAFSQRLLSGRPLDFKVVANASLLAIVYSLSAGVYGLIGDFHPEEVTPELALGIGAATVVTFAASAVLLSVPPILGGEFGIRELWSRHSWLAPHYAAMGVVAFGLIAAYESLSMLGVIVFCMPAVMMRFAMKQYVDKTAENINRLHEQNNSLRIANIEIREVSDELSRTYDSTLEALVNALDARDQETKGHSLRVSRYMMDIARELGVPEGTPEWVNMQRGSLLHDVGKIGVSDNILLKPGKLTDEEWLSMRQHPAIGYNMLKQVSFLEGAAEIVLSHHERWDGKGYPRGLSHDEIPLGARIFSVVDTFDSMTSDRPYRKALSTLEAMKEILKYQGSQFDPVVVEAFLDIYDTWVKEREEMQIEQSLRAA